MEVAFVILQGFTPNLSFDDFKAYVACSKDSLVRGKSDYRNTKIIPKKREINQYVTRPGKVLLFVPWIVLGII